MANSAYFLVSSESADGECDPDNHTDEPKVDIPIDAVMATRFGFERNLAINSAINSASASFEMINRDQFICELLGPALRWNVFKPKCLQQLD